MHTDTQVNPEATAPNHHAARTAALAAHLECGPEDIRWNGHIHVFSAGRREFLVLTLGEATEAARKHIVDSVWAFRPEFIASHARQSLSGAAVKALSEVQHKLCEDANPLVLALIEDVDEFVSDAIAADGLGHFLDTWDGEGGYSCGYHIFRIA